MSAAQQAHPFVRRIAQPMTAAALHARLPSSTLIGDDTRTFDGIAAVAPGATDSLTFCDGAKARQLLGAARASVIIVPAALHLAPEAGRTFVAVTDVRAAFIDAVAWLLPDASRPQDPAPGIDAGAAVEPSARISPAALVGADVSIGAGTRVGPGAIIYGDTRIGSDCVIGANAVIGWVGLAYHDDDDGRRRFFPHLAGVRIGNGVDFGAQACVCRGMLSHTEIGDDAKIGSLVYVSHGVVVEKRAWLSAATAVAGHARIEAGSLLGIGSIVIDNVTIGTDVLVGGGSVVARHAAAGEKMLGVPATAVASMRRFGPTPRD